MSKLLVTLCCSQKLQYVYLKSTSESDQSRGIVAVARQVLHLLMKKQEEIN